MNHKACPLRKTYTCLELLSGRKFFPTFENIFVLENVFLLVLRTRFYDLNLILKDQVEHVLLLLLMQLFFSLPTHFFSLLDTSRCIRPNFKFSFHFLIPKSQVFWQVVRELVYKVYYSRYQVPCYLWQIKLARKLSKLLKYYVTDGNSRTKIH